MTITFINKCMYVIYAFYWLWVILLKKISGLIATKVFLQQKKIFFASY